MSDEFAHLRSLPDGSLTSDEVGILLDRLSAARAENERLRALLLAVMPSRMGSTPDLAWPVGYHGDDPWQQWEDAVAAELNERLSDD